MRGNGAWLLCFLASAAIGAPTDDSGPDDGDNRVNAILEGFKLDVWPSDAYNGSMVHIRVRSKEGPPELTPGQMEHSAWHWRIDVTTGVGGSDVARTLSVPLTPGETMASIDPATLEQGVCRIRPSLVAPSGETWSVWHKPAAPRPPYTADRFLTIHHGKTPSVETRITDRTEFLRELELVGNPGKRRYPGDDASDCHGRSVWDLELHRDRIYVGIGAGGPVEIWSFDPAIDAQSFEEETTVDEESVEVLRSIDGKLYVPGTNATESWDLGNLYIKEADEWRKLRTVPNGIHVLGIVRHDGKLFVTTGTEPGPALFESDDEGRTWKRYGVTESDGRWDWRFYEVGVLGNGLLLTVLQEYFYYFLDGEITRVICPVFPGLVSEYTAPVRVTAFKDGLVYAAGEWWHTGTPKPLYFITNVHAGASAIAGFEDRSVRDIVVREGTCFVLTSTKVGDGYVGEILSTPDLTDWTRLARFHSHAMAQSLEVSGDRFFVGMATLREVSSPQAGNIYELRAGHQGEAVLKK